MTVAEETVSVDSLALDPSVTDAKSDGTRLHAAPEARGFCRDVLTGPWRTGLT